MEAQRLELEEYKEDLSIALKENKVEISLLQIEHTLREYGLEALPGDAPRSFRMEGKGKALPPDVLSDDMLNLGRPQDQHHEEIIDQLRLQLEE